MTFEEYQKMALLTAKDTAKNLPYAALGLSSEAGEVAGKIKKWIRDYNSDPAKLDKSALVSEMGDALWYIAILAHLLDVKFEVVAQKNVNKLADRHKRGTITGTGDNR